MGGRGFNSSFSYWFYCSLYCLIIWLFSCVVVGKGLKLFMLLVYSWSIVRSGYHLVIVMNCIRTRAPLAFMNKSLKSFLRLNSDLSCFIRDYKNVVPDARTAFETAILIFQQIRGRSSWNLFPQSCFGTLKFAVKLFYVCKGIFVIFFFFFWGKKKRKKNIEEGVDAMPKKTTTKKQT